MNSERDTTRRFEREGEAETRRKVQRGHYRGETLRRANEWLGQRQRERWTRPRRTEPATAHARLNRLAFLSAAVLALGLLLVALLSEVGAGL